MNALRSTRLQLLFVAVLLFSLPAQGIAAAALMSLASDMGVTQVHASDHSDHMDRMETGQPAGADHDGHPSDTCDGVCAAACAPGMISAAPAASAPADGAPDIEADSLSLYPLVDDDLRPPRLLVS